MKESHSEIEFQRDIQQINQIPAVAKILEVVCSSTGMGYAAVARVTKDRWIACAVEDRINFGLGVGGELKVETTLCHQVMHLSETVAIDHVKQDPVYFDHHTPKKYGLQSYISVPLFLTNGDFFGTLCAIDPSPATVNNEKTINMFKLFAELIAFHLEALQNLTSTKEQLLEEQNNTETREQFIAILGHDLRNPVGAISTASQLLMRSAKTEKNTKLAKIIQDSAIRVRGRIDNMLDFASGRLGGGIILDYENSDTLINTLQQVISELQTIHPDRQIFADLNLHNDEVSGDYRRIAQLLSNLLGNAVSHGDKAAPIFLNAKSDKGIFELNVINSGKQILPEMQEQLFKPFSRGRVNKVEKGLGLGLFIAQQIAIAHQGKITVTSTDRETVFKFTFPAG